MTWRVGALVLVVLAAAAAVVGAVPLARDVVAGRGTPVIEDVPGPDTGPVCPVDERYVDEEPAGLRDDVLAAWRALRSAAQESGVPLCLNDGKRSAGQQRAEFDEAVRRFGTPELAANYVLPPERSNHVKGFAVDVQPWAAAEWVAANGGVHGWCRRYENEYWHFEYDPAHPQGCPAMLPDATAG
ncbi:D-alanyl-D-alanine carboxypeptidase family protein [Actinophytocola glycyrrhizae]|uniref:D-alanyl-D-alanine carboxypeptidase family protein n=1 Tax=Actinophytocola glycyrrhizae TaxID=2044873 RepID=A0ABV9RY75_9PSEU